MTSLAFDLGTASFATILHFTGQASHKNVIGTISQGLKYFSIASAIDRIARLSLCKENTYPGQLSLKSGIMISVVEEALYSGILQSNSTLTLLPRFVTSLVLGMTATRGITRKAETTKIGLDTKIGLVWAVAREILLHTLPMYYAAPTLTIADSIVFSLAEVCPPQNSDKNLTLEKYSSNWFYKVSSSFFFRITANVAVKNSGFLAALTQHTFFNISRSLPN
ncbi:MAG: hypothetical protein COT84_06155 [Chlamydiae bacterium CG10_big_fil_rev_8_21_14_0_10_35_9]|nr:MAG: hypothetical protein COT84_06155 [Chlamydiae bacterium CG10_big_fil_rev_8_21_14_0_10_35_9]